MNRAGRYILCLFTNVRVLPNSQSKRTLLITTKGSLLLCWFRSMILLPRSYWLSPCVLLWQFSAYRFRSCLNPYQFCFVFRGRVHVPRSFYQPLTLFIKYVRYQCNNAFFLLWLLFDNVCLGVYWSLFPTTCQLLLNKNIHH